MQRHFSFCCIYVFQERKYKLVFLLKKGLTYSGLMPSAQPNQGPQCRKDNILLLRLKKSLNQLHSIVPEDLLSSCIFPR